MSFIKTILTGFGWGLGFAIALTSTFWIYGTYVDTPPQKVEYSWPDDDINSTESLSAEELQKLEVSIKDTYMVEGKISVSGKILNRNDRDAFWIHIKTIVFLGDQVIEVCKPEDEPRIKPDSDKEFMIFCESKWNDLQLGGLRVETIIEKASAYKNT